MHASFLFGPVLVAVAAIAQSKSKPSRIKQGSINLVFLIPLLLIVILPIFDGVIHYHVDYVKSNIWKTKGYTPADQMYWVTHGVDQLLHLLTYVAIVALCV